VDARELLTVTLLVLALGFVVASLLSTVRRGPPLLTRSGTAVVPLPPHQCAQAIADVMAELPSARSVSLSPRDLRVDVRTRGNIRSFGEDITVEATPADGGSLVEVLSRPAFWAIVIDYGANRQNVQDTLHAIVRRCGGTIVESGGTMRA
jgi:hypothetical protein